MKRIISTLLSIVALAVLITACSGPSQEEIDESVALESAQARLAEAESESQSIEESIAAEKSKEHNYEPTDEEKELICGDWYRSVDDGEGDKDIYWLTMDDKGYCKFSHETYTSKDYIDQLDGTWFVDDHGFVNIDLGKYKGKFRFLKNSYGSTNIICADGDDFVESGEEGAYAAFVPVKWYKGKLRFVDADEVKAETDATVRNSDEAADSDTADTASGTEGAQATASEEPQHKMIYVEMQGEGDTWFRLAGIDGYCKVDVDTREGEIPCRLAINQNDHLVVKIQQIR